MRRFFKGRKGNSNASAISDRSGKKYPMREMVIEPGTGWLVHKSESDGRYSLNEHPVNNKHRYLRGKQGDPYPVENARPRAPYPTGISVFNVLANVAGTTITALQADFEKFVETLLTGQTGLQIAAAPLNALRTLVVSGVTNTLNVVTQNSAVFVDTVGAGQATLNISPSTANFVKGFTSLNALIPSCVADWDFSIPASYNGSGSTWTNLVSGGSDYDLTLDTDNFAWESEGWVEMTGTGKLAQIAANTDLINHIHQTGANATDWAFAIAFNYQTNSSNQFFFATNNSATESGMRFYKINLNFLRVIQNSGASFVTATNSTALVGGTDYLLTVSYDSSENTLTFSINGVEETESLTYLSNTDNAARLFTIGAEADDGGALETGTLVYGCALFNSTLSSSDIATLKSQYELRQVDNNIVFS